MKIRMVSVPISPNDYERALRFYTEVLGFIKHTDKTSGGTRLVTLVSAEEPDGPYILLEPAADYPAMKNLRDSLRQDGIAFAAFAVADVQREYERLTARGVKFITAPSGAGEGAAQHAIFDDTLGNLIMIYAEAATD